MGSFANSLHVRSNDPGRVADVMRQVLADTGYVPTNKEPKLGPFQATRGPERAVVVCEAYGGWVGVLDSDFMQSMSILAGELSRRLDTYAIQFLVNDSDSWNYELYQRGTQLDEFDSSGGFDDDEDFDGDDDDEEAVAPGEQTISAAEWPAMQQKLNERMAEQQRRMFAQMPPDIRDIQQKVQRGAASRDEMQKYSQWAQAQAAEMMRSLSDIIPGATQFADRLTQSPRPKPGGDDPSLKQRVEKLRPLLAAGVSDDDVLEILGREAVFAEETLGEFLPLLGIAPLFANLSYAYLQEFGDRDLGAQNVKVAQRLKYEAAPALSR